MAGLAFALLPGTASAYCRATTCDPSRQSCAEDAELCFTDGHPVYWGTDCISVSVQADGAPEAGIDYAAARASVERAFNSWKSVTCPGGGHPSFRFEITEPVTCKRVEYNSNKRNANIIMFRGDSWPYTGMSQDTLGYTRLTFDPDTGSLYDVDIEINAVAEPLAVGRPPTSREADLDSIVTHEVGHFLGLNHSLNVEATMVAGYQTGSTELRTPHIDDITGICAIYPPNRTPESTSCAPRHGFAELCGDEQPDEVPMDDEEVPGNESQGCAFGRASGAPRGSWLAVALVSVAAVRRRRSPRVEP